MRIIEEQQRYYQENLYNPQEINQELVKFLKNKLSGNLVFDLGAGNRGAGYILADAMEAGGYIGEEIEKYFEEIKGNWSGHFRIYKKKEK